MRPSVYLAALPALLCFAPDAAAHSVMKVDGGTIHYTANDDVSLNDLSVTFEGNQIRFFDRGADGGISPPPDNSCSPGDETDANGYIYEVLCPRAGKTALRIDVGEAQDKITAQLPLNVTAVGGSGADTILTGDGADVLNGGSANDTIRAGGGNDQIVGEVGDDQLFGEAGDDVVQAALGADTADGGAGNDDIRVRDGVTDKAVCADGADKVQADDRDEIDAACEAVDRQVSAEPPAEQQPPPGQDGGGGPPRRPTPRRRGCGRGVRRSSAPAAPAASSCSRPRARPPISSAPAT
jgi:hypothetical protein